MPCINNCCQMFVVFKHPGDVLALFEGGRVTIFQRGHISPWLSGLIIKARTKNALAFEFLGLNGIINIQLLRVPPFAQCPRPG